MRARRRKELRARRPDLPGRRLPRILGAPRTLRTRRGLRGLRSRLAREDGNALVEFVALSVILLIPSLYLVLSLGSVQGAVFAADVIARDAARIHATEPDASRAKERTEAMVRMTLEDHGLSAQDAVTVRCSKDPCSAAGSEVTAEVSIGVPIPGLGPMLGQDGPVHVGAEHVVEADQFRAPGERAGNESTDESTTRDGGAGQADDGTGPSRAPDEDQEDGA